MRINAGQVGQVVLSTLQGAKELDGKLELKVGSVVRATLMQHAGKDEVWLQIGGKNVRARLDANVKPGDQVDLLVTGEQKQGAMELKVVGQPIRGGEGGKQLDIAGLVRALGLPETEETKALVQEFAARGVPLKPETVRAALTVLRSLPQVTPSHIATLGKMAELGIPILPSTFEAMHTLETGPKLHDLLTKIQTTLQTLLPQAGKTAAENTSAPRAGSVAPTTGAATNTPAPSAGTAAPSTGAATNTPAPSAGTATPSTGAATNSPAPSAGTATPSTGVVTNSPASSAGTATPSTGAATNSPAPSAGTATSTGAATNSPAPSAGTATPSTGVATNTPAPSAGTATPSTGAATNTPAPSAGTAAPSTGAATNTTAPSSGTAAPSTGAATNSPAPSAGTATPSTGTATNTPAPAPSTPAAPPPGRVHFPENTPQAANSLSAPTRANLEQLLHVTTQLLHSPDDAAQTAGQLADKAKQLGLNFEEQLANALRRLPPGSDAAQIHNALQQTLKLVSEQGTTLKHALLLTQAAAAELDAAGLSTLQQDLSTVLKNVTGQQLMQTAGSDRADLLYQFAAVPIRHGKDEQTVELHVMARKSPGQKSIDPANCYVLFRLDMPNLGELDIHLHIVDKVVGVRFLSDNHADMTLTPADQRDLRDALQNVGFHLGVLKVEDKKRPEPGDHQPLLPPILTHKQFDLKI